MKLVRSILFAAAAILVAQHASAQTAPPFASFDLAGPAVLNDPHDLAIGPDGRLYVADKFASRIAVLDPETLELVDEIVPGRLPGVHDVHFAPDGRAIVAVTGGDAAVVFDDLAAPDPRPVAVLPGARTEGAAIHSSGRAFVVSSGSGEVLVYDPPLGGDAFPVAVAGGHWGAHDVAEAPDGSIWVADNFNRRLVNYDVDLNLLRVIDHPRFDFVGPRYLDVDASGRLVVADQDAHRILLIDPDAPDGGALLGILGDGIPGAGPGKFDDPEGVAVDGARFYFSDSDNDRVVRYVIVVN